MEGVKKSGSSHNGNGGKHWTKEEIEKLIRMRDKEGKTYKECSKELPGRTERACQQFGRNGHTNGHKNGNGKKKRWTEENEEDLKRYKIDGFLDETIAEIMGRTVESVRNKWKKVKKQILKDEADEEEMLELLSDGDNNKGKQKKETTKLGLTLTLKLKL